MGTKNPKLDSHLFVRSGILWHTIRANPHTLYKAVPLQGGSSLPKFYGHLFGILEFGQTLTRCTNPFLFKEARVCPN